MFTIHYTFVYLVYEIHAKLYIHFYRTLTFIFPHLWIFPSLSVFKFMLDVFAVFRSRCSLLVLRYEFLSIIDFIAHTLLSMLFLNTHLPCEFSAIDDFELPCLTNRIHILLHVIMESLMIENHSFLKLLVLYHLIEISRNVTNSLIKNLVNKPWLLPALIKFIMWN